MASLADDFWWFKWPLLAKVRLTASSLIKSRPIRMRFLSLHFDVPLFTVPKWIPLRQETTRPGAENSLEPSPHAHEFKAPSPRTRSVQGRAEAAVTRLTVCWHRTLTVISTQTGKIRRENRRQLPSKHACTRSGAQLRGDQGKASSARVPPRTGTRLRYELRLVEPH